MKIPLPPFGNTAGIHKTNSREATGLQSFRF